MHHPYIEVGVAEPLNGLIHVGHCPKGNLRKEGREKMESLVQLDTACDEALKQTASLDITT